MKTPGREPISGSPRQNAEAGFALLTVLIFALIVGIVGTAFFAMASMENRQARYREDSSEAFYLADGAIEQARGEFLDDINWRGPIPPTTLGNGTYDLTATDSTWTDGDPAVYLRAEGHVRDSDRAVEAWVRLRPVGGENFIVMNNMISDHGNLCLEGHIHVNNEAEFGSNDVNLKCGGTYTEGFPIEPPPAYTEPGYFPNSTYYYVYGDPITKDKAYVYRYDRALADTVNITASITDMADKGVFTYDNKTKRFVYDFSKQITLPSGKEYAWRHFFDYGGSQFVPDTANGETSVVINFGDPYGPPQTLSDIIIGQQPGSEAIRTTIINTRFVGVTPADRLDSKKWVGGALYFGVQATLTPDNCIGLIIHDVDFGNAKVQLGTAASPALNYITHDIVKINGQLAVEGTMIVLHDFFNTGGPDITFNGAFLSCLPEVWQENFYDDGSAIMVLLEWKEIPAKG